MTETKKNARAEEKKVFISWVYQSEKKNFFPPHSFISIVVYTVDCGKQKIHYWTSMEENGKMAEKIAQDYSRIHGYEIVREKIVTDGDVF